MRDDAADQVAPSQLGLAHATAMMRAAKRTIDLLGSAIGLVLLSWLFLLIAVAIRLTSPGPSLYFQYRVGRNGELFRLYKFRSMYRHAEAMRGELESLNECSGPVFKMQRDPRVTPVGRLLRRSSLDELPQLVNVLLGQMSLVGPRPALPEEYATYSRTERRRVAVKPGLTCIWQVSGRSTIDFDTWVRMDLDYIDHWSLWLDLKLLLRTIPAVARGHGAY